ncbi:MAG: hypothetical protein LBD76_07335 [Prevotellaceae bacterium]|jgi:hypothetical protein|nr:hypothetical protein [Prevotellaceae bacterium]
MKKVLSKSGLITLLFSLCLMLYNTAAEAQNVHTATSDKDSAETLNCRNLAKFLDEEFLQSTASMKNNVSARLYGLQEKDAMAKALAVCAKLKAKKLQTESEDLLFQLPEGLGTIVIHEVYDDGVFLKMSFVTDCNRLSYDEIWYVSLKRYNKQ